MNYPTLEEVEKASKIQLGKWVRFLKSPGMSAVESGSDNVEPVRIKEAAIMDKVMSRFYSEMGGWDPATSKALGWDKPAE